MPVGSESAKKAWATRRANLALAPTQGKVGRKRVAIRGQFNPYNPQTQQKEYDRWRSHMKRYGRMLTDEEVQAKRVKAIRKWWKQNRKPSAVKDYNAPKKNRIRKAIITRFKAVHPKRIVSLESPAGLFVKGFSGVEHLVFENDPIQYKKMLDNGLANSAEIVLGDVKDLAKHTTQSPDCVWLDYCKTFHSQEPDLYTLRPALTACKKLAFTFSIREHDWKWKARHNGDFKMELVGRLLKIFRGFEFEYGISYKDDAAMVCVVLTKAKENRNRVPTKTVAASVPVELANQFKAEAERTNVSMSEIVRNKLMR